MRDEEQRQPVSLLHVLEDVQDLGLDAHVERGNWLVTDEQFRLEGERASDADALALTAGEFGRLAITDDFGVEADGGEKIAHLGLAFLFVAAVPHLQRLLHEGVHLEMWIE